MSMLTGEEQQELEGDFRTLRLIWMALVAAVVLYVFVGFVVERMVGAVDPGMKELPGYGRPLVQYGVYVVAAAVLAFGVWRGRTAGRTEVRGQSGGVKLARSTYRTRMLVAFASCEAAALLGFVSLVYSGDLVRMSVVAGCALVAMIYITPRRDEFVQLAEKLKLEGGQSFHEA
jgi:F0F1-type ATP synthase membrane subunit c/vacuolar-type H+-ATPase subunit K